MRGGIRFGPQSEKEDIDTAHLVQLFQICDEITLDIAGLGLHRSEALYLSKEVVPQQPFEIANKAKGVVHPHGCKRVLSDDVQTAKQFVDLARLGELAYNAVHRLGAASAKEYDDNVAVLLIRVFDQFVEHGSPDRLLVGKDFEFEGT